MANTFRDRAPRGHMVDLVVATLAAVALWAVGLGEVSWAPFFFVAVSVATPNGLATRLRGAVRS